MDANVWKQTADMNPMSGSAGFVAINNVDSDWTTTFTTSMADGTYCDVISGASGASSSASCTGSASVDSLVLLLTHSVLLNKCYNPADSLCLAGPSA